MKLISCCYFAQSSTAKIIAMHFLSRYMSICLYWSEGKWFHKMSFLLSNYFYVHKHLMVKMVYYYGISQGTQHAFVKEMKMWANCVCAKSFLRQWILLCHGQIYQKGKNALLFSFWLKNSGSIIFPQHWCYLGRLKWYMREDKSWSRSSHLF